MRNSTPRVSDKQHCKQQVLPRLLHYPLNLDLSTNIPYTARIDKNSSKLRLFAIGAEGAVLIPTNHLWRVLVVLLFPLVGERVLVLEDEMHLLALKNGSSESRGEEKSGCFVRFTLVGSGGGVFWSGAGGRGC